MRILMKEVWRNLDGLSKYTVELRRPSVFELVSRK